MTGPGGALLALQLIAYNAAEVRSGQVGGAPKRSLLHGGAAVMALAAAGCSLLRSHPPPAVQPAPAVTSGVAPIVGVASWYGPGFDGHRTASGEIYDQNDLTAASTAFPLGSRVMVTNLANSRSVEVRINDRGPFVKGRRIDLSRAAARALGIVRPGTAQVRIETLSVPPGARTVGAPLQYYVQVGSFSHEGYAARLRARLAAEYHNVRVDKLRAGGRVFYRVRIGAFTTRDDAERRARDIARLGYPLIIVTE